VEFSGRLYGSGLWVDFTSYVYVSSLLLGFRFEFSTKFTARVYESSFTI